MDINLDNLDSLSTKEFLMRKAIEMAKKSGIRVAPNPMVGAIIVNDGQIIGQGVHKEYGGDHAEINALKSVKEKKKIEGSTMIVTLEPCRHYGQTPPCLLSVYNSGVNRLIIGSKDPFQKKFNCPQWEIPTEFLKGKIAKECKLLNKYFFTFVEKKRPFITVKIAVTPDGFVSGHSRQRVHITDDNQNEFVHNLRVNHQAILVGFNTAILDNPQLNVRHYRQPVYNTFIPQPKRIILDSRLEIPLSYKVFKDSNYLVATTPSGLQNRPHLHAKENLWVSPTQNRISLPKLFKFLAQQKISSVLVEPGPTLYYSLKRLGLIDEKIILKGKKKIGSGLRINI